MRAWTRLRSRFGGSAPAVAPAGRDVLKWVAAAFALVATATAEYDLARAIGMNEWVAAAVPGALDAYVVRALRAHREVLTAVLAMVAVNAGSHLVTADVLPVAWPLITAVSAIAPLVLWRVHALGTPGQWRARKLWGLGKAEHAPVLASTEPEHTEHDRAPDNPEPPGTREHPEGCALGLDPCDYSGACTACGKAEHALSWPVLCYCGADVWDDLGAHQRAPGHPVDHTASTDQARVHAQTDAWGDDWMDVHDAVEKQPAGPKGPVGPKGPAAEPTPAHAPYTDHVPMEPTGLLTVPGGSPVSARHLSLVKDENASTETEHWCGKSSEHAEHAHGDKLLCSGVVGGIYGTASTVRTADDWNLEHVSTGVLTPADTVHMDKARELFHTRQSVPGVREIKAHVPVGTPRAQRLRDALKAEHTEETS